MSEKQQPRLSPAQKRYLEVARANGGGVNDYGSKATGQCLVRLGLMIDKGGHVSNGFPNQRGTYRRYVLSAAGIKITEPKQ